MASPNPTAPVLAKKQIDRFWSKVAIAGPDDCWLWTDGTVCGYGKFSIGSKPTRKRYGAHVLARFLKTGEWRGDRLTCHSCDVKLCCNPAHLWLGTHADNNTDRSRKGRTAKGNSSGRRKHPERYPRGDKHHMAKVTKTMAEEVLRLHATGEHSQEAIGQKFGIHQGTVSRIVRHAHYYSVQMSSCE